jgi:hypothetical protein
VASLVALLSSVWGLWICFQSGTITTAAFSTVLLATRNPDLDKIKEHDLHHSAQKSFMNTRLKFGQTVMKEINTDSDIMEAREVFYRAET